MRNLLIAFIILGGLTSGFCQQPTEGKELNIRLSPSVSSQQLAELARVAKPISYTTQPGDSLASLSYRLFGIKQRMRQALRELNPVLVVEMKKQGKDFFWQELPAGEIVQLPPFSKIINDVTVTANSKKDALSEAKIYYWQVGPLTVDAISDRNAQVFESLTNKAINTASSKRKPAVVFPAVPTFQTLQIRDGKIDEAANVLASLEASSTVGRWPLASGGIGTPAFIEKVISPCVVDATDGWFDKVAHINEVAITKSDLHATTIAVLDSGIDLNHAALKTRLWDGGVAEIEGVYSDPAVNRTVGVNFTSNPPSNDVTDVDPNSHGTHVSGIASGAAIARGLQPPRPLPFGDAIRIMPLKVVDKNLHVDIHAIEGALQFAQKFHANIISASWNVDNDLDLQTEMRYDQGSLFVLAAGNGKVVGAIHQGLDLGNSENQIYPASFMLENAITVGALGANGDPTEFSNFDLSKKVVHLFAPGCAINSTVKDNGYDSETGTSQAVPFVSLTAALIWAQNPALPPSRVKNRILQTADPANASLEKSLAGNLNVAKAVSIMKDLIETDDGYSYGEVLNQTITVAATGDSCEETDPISIRKQKLTRLYRNYGGSGQDVAVQQNGFRTTGKICSIQIVFKDELGHVEPIPFERIVDVVFRL